MYEIISGREDSTRALASTLLVKSICECVRMIAGILLIDRHTPMVVYTHGDATTQTNSLQADRQQFISQHNNLFLLLTT